MRGPRDPCLEFVQTAYRDGNVGWASVLH